MKAIAVKTKDGQVNNLLFNDEQECYANFHKIGMVSNLFFINDEMQFEQYKDQIPQDFNLKYQGPGLYDCYTMKKSEKGMVVVDSESGTSYELIEEYKQIEEVSKIAKDVKFDLTKINFN